MCKALKPFRTVTGSHMSVFKYLARRQRDKYSNGFPKIRSKLGKARKFLISFLNISKHYRIKSYVLKNNWKIFVIFLFSETKLNYSFPNLSSNLNVFEFFLMTEIGLNGAWILRDPEILILIFFRKSKVAIHRSSCLELLHGKDVQKKFVKFTGKQKSCRPKP